MKLSYADLFRRPTTKPKERLKVGDRVRIKYGEGVIVVLGTQYVGVKADNGTTYGLERADIKEIM
jgi:hypothetical protein